MAKREPIILTAEDYDQIQAELRHLEEIKPVMEKACKVGVNCDEYWLMHDQTKAWFENVLKVWFPKGRPK